MDSSVGRTLGVGPEELRTLGLAAVLHDAGKLIVPAQLLDKPTALEPQELELVQTHALAGYEMLLEKGVHSAEVLDVVRFHHERLDGSGYPYALSGDQISLKVRIVMICDIYAALRENRPYNDPMDWAAARARMQAKRSRRDMELLARFAALVTTIETSCDL